MKSVAIVAFVLALGIAIAQESTTDVPPEPTTEETTTPNPGLPIGSYCNGLIATCNRYSNTVACLQRRPDPTTTESPITEEPTTQDPILAVLLQKAAAPRDICETGFTVDLGRCACSRNCKQGIYVDDGIFDEEREICVGLVGSACSLLVPNCVKNGHCNFLASACVCDAGYSAGQNRTCEPSF
ncbi:unnamed protein product [Orchesella dallaii]|uniref:EGF-like domain-containing protein n=1 Tax=Orchesella dallaii TaxID=48710 RepID=A0ABP1QJF2_9HEXA